METYDPINIKVKGLVVFFCQWKVFLLLAVCCDHRPVEYCYMCIDADCMQQNIKYIFILIHDVDS